MAQNVVDFSGNPSGSGLMDDYLDKDQQNVLTSNSGIQRPSYAVAGTKWLDTSVTPWVWKMYDGTSDVTLGTVNPSTHLFTPKTPLTTAGDILVQGADGNLSKLAAGVAGTVLTANGAEALPTYKVNPIGVLTYSASYTYKKNDVVVSTNEDDETALYKSLVDSNIGNDLSDDTKWEKLALGGGGDNIGDIKYTARTDVPNGGAWCDGALYTKAQFPDVYQMLVDGKIQSTTVTDFDSKVSANGSCGFFGLDTANERFKVPLLKDVYIKAGQAPSMFGAESLPNITGKATATYIWVNGFAEGAFEFENGIPIDGTGDGRTSKNLKIDASRSSSTYQDGAKVNPDHVVYRAYVVLYTSATEASEAQAAELINALGSKANTNLSNISANIDYVVESKVNSDGSWYRKYKSGWLEQGGIGLTVRSDGTKTVTLIKPFNDTKYTVNWLDQNGFTIQGGGSRGVNNKTTTSFVACNGQDRTMNIGWVAIGQGA